MLFVVAALAAGFYMLQIPLKVAFCVRADERVGAALGVRPFAGNSAMKAARMRLENGKPKKKPKKKRKQKPNPGLLWAVGRRLLAHVRLEECARREKWACRTPPSPRWLWDACRRFCAP